ncbi:hypothetical protein CQW23_13642 [Capsicum baccatum]|uniref:Cupin type-1 domain-containing protein n=1 Tax=Capsicum baccatum TaxID=33114 RepID=A0A2G2WGX8_CAPBA|nr:hypothetical protein CQW23_13642 [Capsicum baccatum]
MAITWFSLFLSLLLLLHGYFAQHQRYQQQQGQCQINRLNAQQPSFQMLAEAGYTEFFDLNNQQFQCAGVSVFRHVVQSKGLLLPSYTNSPILAYVVQGRGFYGLMNSGCPETFQSSQKIQRFQDRHQRIEQFRQGDIMAFPAGTAHWVYNEGNEELVLVFLEDASNNANQLDQVAWRIFIAGKPHRALQHQGRQYGGRSYGNVFSGFDIEILSEAFGVCRETARKLQGQDDMRGHIISVQEGLKVIRPPFSQEQEQQQHGQYDPMNGIEETICSAKVRQNIDDPSHADIYNPHAGRFTTINSFTLPILRFLKLSASRGVLYRNSMMAPHWYSNAHSIVYITRGESRMQVVDHRGQAVLDDRVREGQFIVVPQNYAIVTQSGNGGCEWITFNTNDNAMINTLSGRTSAIRGLPVDVIANAYQISRDEARSLKFSREETLICPVSTRSLPPYEGVVSA